MKLELLSEKLVQFVGSDLRFCRGLRVGVLARSFRWVDH